VLRSARRAGSHRLISVPGTPSLSTACPICRWIRLKIDPLVHQRAAGRPRLCPAWCPTVHQPCAGPLDLITVAEGVETRAANSTSWSARACMQSQGIFYNAQPMPARSAGSLAFFLREKPLAGKPLIADRAIGHVDIEPRRKDDLERSKALKAGGLSGSPRVFQGWYTVTNPAARSSAYCAPGGGSPPAIRKNSQGGQSMLKVQVVMGAASAGCWPGAARCAEQRICRRATMHFERAGHG